MWKPGSIDMEITDIKRAKRLMYEHQEFTQVPNFDDLLEKYIRIMKSGISE